MGVLAMDVVVWWKRIRALYINFLIESPTQYPLGIKG